MSSSTSLYIHFPFCRKKCNYCAFVSWENLSGIEVYLAALEREIKSRGRGFSLDSIYFGGGTPSLLSIAQLESIVASVKDGFRLKPNTEITLEVNPATIGEKYLFGLRQLGVNRLSIGVQSFTDLELAMLGRIHSSSQAETLFRKARRAGFENINLDIIYSLPGQTLDSWKHTLERAVGLEPDHISAYGLSLEKGSPMQRMVDSGKLESPDPDVGAEQYELTEMMLESFGYSHYEISNWARPGRQCLHNLTYWQDRPYIGVGVAAHSYDGRDRWSNTKSLEKYIRYIPGKEGELEEMREQISPELRRSEALILGLRQCRGVSVEDFNRAYLTDIFSLYADQFEELSCLGLVVKNRSNLSLTPAGRLLSNEVFWRLLP